MPASALQAELPERRRRVGIGFDLRAAELAGRRAKLSNAAIRIAAGWERDRGADLRNVSRPELARLAGLPDWPGFDLLATRPGGNVRSIEVKGRAGRAPVQLEANVRHLDCVAAGGSGAGLRGTPWAT